MFIKKFTYRSDEEIESVYYMLVKNMPKYEFEYNILEKSDSELVFRCSRIPLTKGEMIHYECFITINKIDDIYYITVKPNGIGFEIFYIIIAVAELVNIIIMIYIFKMNGLNGYAYHFKSTFLHILFVNLTFHKTYRSLDKKQILTKITNSIQNS